MRIGIVSDSHDNIWKVREALPTLAGTDAVIHCGDLCAPFTIVEFAEPLKRIPLHLVWGNNDGDRFRISKVASGYANVNLHAEFGEFKLGEHFFGVSHYPMIARGLAQSGKYDVVCYGHDHIKHVSTLGETLLINPGDLMGKDEPSRFAVLDTETMVVDQIKV